MKFNYKSYAPTILRPVIPIEIIHKKIKVPYEVLVDSGADICIFDAQIVEILGINLKIGKEQKVAGLTGVSEVYYLHPVTIAVGGREYKIEVGFLSSMGKFGYGVVGQKGFFDIFIVTFDLVKEELELKTRSLIL
ncbi:MAG: hypothetical protein HY429_00940 [Candidatus Levybacteria bacterium]|nr:hypothetical protein [Candidatus Daviesbacteria bacterium]MBI4078844.1 hypothetical protein [Candidatus Levybacteria bacterium]